MKTSKRTKQLAMKRKARAHRAKSAGGESTYSRKRNYCNSRGVWGFEVPEPKPWRSK